MTPRKETILEDEGILKDGLLHLQGLVPDPTVWISSHAVYGPFTAFPPLV